MKMSGAFTIVTHVNPVLTNQIASADRDAGGACRPPIMEFLKGHPKALGIVQIMIGVVTFLFGFVLPFSRFIPISVFSGIMYWGSLIYIISGALSVAAEPKLHPCVVKSSLGMNVVNTIVSGTAVILFSIDCFLQLMEPDHIGEVNEVTAGACGVLAVLSLLQFFISICVSAFACKATCCSDPMVSVVAVAHPADVSPQGMNGVMSCPATGSPPAYSMAESQLTNRP